MSKTKAITAITKLVDEMKSGDIKDIDEDAVIDLAIKEGVLETLLDELVKLIDDLRPPKAC